MKKNLLYFISHFLNIFQSNTTCQNSKGVDMMGKIKMEKANSGFFIS